MAKISPVSIKYMIHAKFEAIGPVEKPDVIGAIFGQTEGLLGAELEIRDLQKEGKIGRIEVETESANGKTTGKIHIPTALDQSETSLIAAAIETIEKIGPTEAKIVVEKIEDVRGNKRDYIIERAKRLLEGFDGSTNSREISDMLRSASRTSKLIEYGEDKLPCGDLSGEEIIVVEGRADVVNLLENRVYNVISMNGTKLPKTIIDLSKEKQITLFLDGDRGGKLIAKNVIENAEVDFIVFAPDGKEVEELNGKEILASLRKKIPPKEFSSYSSRSDDRERYENRTRSYERRDDRRDFVRDNRNENEPLEKVPKNNYEPLEKVPKNNSDEEEHAEEKGSKPVEKVSIDKAKLRPILLKEVANSKKAYFLDQSLNVVKKIPKTNILKEISRVRGAVVLAIDGKATSQIASAAKRIGIQYIAANTFAENEEDIEYISF